MWMRRMWCHTECRIWTCQWMRYKKECMLRQRWRRCQVCSCQSAGLPILLWPQAKNTRLPRWPGSTVLHCMYRKSVRMYSRATQAAVTDSPHGHRIDPLNRPHMGEAARSSPHALSAQCRNARNFVITVALDAQFHSILVKPRAIQRCVHALRLPSAADSGPFWCPFPARFHPVQTRPDRSTISGLTGFGPVFPGLSRLGLARLVLPTAACPPI